jgi:rubrerythrin
MSGILAEKSATLANLGAAFENHSNQHARYTAFAAQADAEGWFGAASFFRAVARSEQIQAQNLARTIQQLGAEPHCRIHVVEIDQTPQNLETALAALQHEIDSTYPASIIEAGADANSVAELALTRALETEKTHAALFHATIELVSEGPDAWISSPKNFYLCPVCGFTSGMKDQEIHCPVCHLAWNRFEVVR